MAAPPPYQPPPNFAYGQAGYGAAPPQQGQPGYYPPPAGSYPPPTGYSDTPYAPYKGGVDEDADLEANTRGGSSVSGGIGLATGFSDRAIRAGFIRKVYFTLSVQLAITTAIVALFTFSESVKSFIQSNIYLYYLGYAVFLVTYIMLVCCKSVRRKFPANVIMMTIFTLALSYMVGVISSFYDVQSVFIALGITTGVTISVSLFACQTKYDFTKWIGVLFVVSIAFMLFGFFCIFFYSNILQVVYAGIGAVLFTIFLAVDTQLIIGGKRHELSPEDHILGAIMLYIDIVYIFLFILQLVGGSDR